MSHTINSRCTLCKACVDICPTKSIFAGEGQYVIDSDTCDDCKVCVSVCPERAIQAIPRAAAPATTGGAQGKAGAHGKAAGKK
jgi:ferredoxin